MHAGEVFIEYRGFIRSVVRQYVQNRDDINDILQLVAIAVMRATPKYRGEASIKTWLRIITRNTAISFRRKRDNARRFEGMVTSTRTPSRPEDGAIAVENAMLVRHALAKLPECLRDILTATAMDGMSRRDVSATFHIPQSTICGRLHKAKCLMRKYLSPHFEACYA